MNVRDFLYFNRENWKMFSRGGIFFTKKTFFLQYQFSFDYMRRKNLFCLHFLLCKMMIQCCLWLFTEWNPFNSNFPEFFFIVLHRNLITFSPTQWHCFSLPAMMPTNFTWDHVVQSFAYAIYLMRSIFHKISNSENGSQLTMRSNEFSRFMNIFIQGFHRYCWSLSAPSVGWNIHVAWNTSKRKASQCEDKTNGKLLF